MGYMNYEERLEVAKRLYELSNTEQKTALECIFPELCESEDEKIRKRLIDFFEDWHKNRSHCWGIAVTDILAWLEKQGQQNLPIEKLPSEMKTIGESLGFTTQEECDDYNKMVTDLIMSDDDKGEQKPTETVKWSAQEEYCICELKAMVRKAWRKAENVRNDVTIKKMQELMFFLKTLNPNKKSQRIISAEAKETMYDSPTWSEEDMKEALRTEYEKGRADAFAQRQKEWSEEDEQYLLVCKNALAKYQTTDKWDADIISCWLENKLKAPQTTWKPSDRQMEVLVWCKPLFVDPKSKGILESLINDLKKLKGE